MKQIIIFLIAAVTISCDGKRNTPKPKEVDTVSHIDTVCVGCNGNVFSGSDSIPIYGKDFDIKDLIFREYDNPDLLDVATVKIRVAFYSFLKANASKYDNNLIVYIGRQDKILFCYRQGTYDTSTKLPIMSASKMVTAAVIMSIVESGKLSLDDKVSKFIPSFNNDKKSITIRQLLSHTSGIVVDSPYDNRSNLTLQQAVDSIAIRTKLHFLPGTKSLYGSTAYSIVARVAEVVEKKSWSQIFQERIGSKCGMEHVVYSPEHPFNPAAGYGIICSMNEYLRFLTMIYNKGTYDGVRVLSTASVETMELDNTNNVDPAHGLGLFRSEIQNNIAQEVACHSAVGVQGWINRKKNFYGLIFTQAGYNKTIESNLAFRKLVREKL